MKLNWLNRFKNSPAIQPVVIVDPTNYAENDEDFKFTFTSPLKIDKSYTRITIGSSTYKSSQALIIYNQGKIFAKLVFPDAMLSISSQAIKFDHYVAIGLGYYFYLYDLRSQSVSTFINLNNYFSNFKIYQDQLFVIYDSGIFCINNTGNLKWHNYALGPSGVTVDEIKNDRIFGTEQYEISDHYRSFVLELDSGMSKGVNN